MCGLGFIEDSELRQGCGATSIGSCGEFLQGSGILIVWMQIEKNGKDWIVKIKKKKKTLKHVPNKKKKLRGPQSYNLGPQSVVSSGSFQGLCYHRKRTAVRLVEEA